MNQTKIDTLSKAQTWKMTPYAREEQKLKIFFKSLWYYFNFGKSFVFRLTGCLHTAIFAETI